MRFAFCISAATCGIYAFGIVQAASAPIAPFSFEQAYGRLPKDVVPLDYSIAITPDANTQSLSGEESIVLDFRKPTAVIEFNSLHETLREVRFDGRPVQQVDSRDAQQLTVITLPTAAYAGRHTLRFSYIGKLETGPRGLFSQHYVASDGSTQLLISSKFESTEARRMFPCWDEPAFRATMQLTATFPSAWTAVSNMPVARRLERGANATTVFERTPKMPTYLLELSAGDLAAIHTRVGDVELGIWAVRGQQLQGAEALANSAQILSDYDDYFGYHFPLPKLDAIAVPGGFGGAMENWGAITYNDQLLLMGASSTVRDRQVGFAVQAHEIAHQWNGDLVTMGWWDDIWLNESFASWRAADETELRHPDWKWWEGQDRNKENAMQADARSSSHPIQRHVSDELQIDTAFDSAITYDKGQAVLRMLETWLGPETFRNGIRRFIRAHAYSNATSADLWNALSAASGRDVGAIAAEWVEQSGFPLVSVSARCDGGQRTITLSQQRFLLSGIDSSPTHWSVPLQIRAGGAKPQAVLLSQPAQMLPAGHCDEALSINAGAVGYFRAAYDPSTLALNTRAFATSLDGDRIALLDDEWAMAESGQRPLAEFLALCAAMGTDLDARAWNVITTSLTTIEYAERDRPNYANFTALARSIVRPVVDRLGWDAKPNESPATQQLRRTLIADLGAWGDEQVIAEARRRFAAFLADHGALTPDDQATVLSIVARNADAASFEQLHALARSARDETERRRFYLALMQVRDPQLAAQSATIAASAEIPPQTAPARWGLVRQLSIDNPSLAWSTFTRNYDVVMLPQGRYALLYTAEAGPEVFWDALPLEQLQSWTEAHTPESLGDSVARGMEMARFELARKRLLARAADAYLQSAPPHD
jgi:aminopeptidase N